MELGLSGRVCVVSGASRGIGKATAVSLAQEGAIPVLVGRREHALAEAAAACREAGGHADATAIDVTDPDAGERIVAFCLERHGRIDALVNNAGGNDVKTIEQLTDEDWRQQWELHVMAPMRLMRTAAPVMAERGWGRIVNISSTSGKRPGTRNMAYSVTKAAELSLSRSFADLYASRGVLVNAITPGPVATDAWIGAGGLADQVAQAQGITREEVLERTAAGVPVGRLGDDDEIARVITFLCSEAASFVAGAAWSVDGGVVPVII